MNASRPSSYDFSHDLATASTLVNEGQTLYQQENIKIYVGYLGGYDGMPEVEEWARQIALVEQLLIYTHWPAGNSSGIKDFKVDQPEQEFYDTHVLNWEQRRSLLPEVSAARWSDRFEGNEGYVVFRSSPSALDDQETPATAKNSNKSKMASFSTKGEVLNDECSVKITDKEILVEYESYDGGGLHQYRGKNSGDGHFKLTRVPKGGEATLHRFSPSSQILEGYWSEDGERGMWRIELAGE